MFDILDEALVDALQKDCNKWAPGLEIIAIRVTKPKVPMELEQSYQSIEKEKANYNIIGEKSNVVKQELAMKRS